MALLLTNAYSQFSHDDADSSIMCLVVQVEHAKIIKIVQNIWKLVPLELLLN